jgi:hypothetical protein
LRGLPESDDRALALASIEPSPEALDALIALCDRASASFPARVEQYDEGLITIDELEACLEPVAHALRLWSAHGLTPARRASAEQAKARCREHRALEASVTGQRLLATPT